MTEGMSEVIRGSGKIAVRVHSCLLLTLVRVIHISIFIEYTSDRLAYQ
jgi:hypothetical protein